MLRELFGFNYGEIASAVGKSESAARQIAHRAHEHVQTRRQRFEPVDLRRRAEITAQFFGAAELIRIGLPDMRVEMASCNTAPANPSR